MTVKNIIKIQHAIVSVVDYIEGSTDDDESGIRQQMLDELSLSDKILQKEKERIYLNNAKQRIKNRT